MNHIAKAAISTDLAPWMLRPTMNAGLPMPVNFFDMSNVDRRSCHGISKTLLWTPVCLVGSFQLPPTKCAIRVSQDQVKPVQIVVAHGTPRLGPPDSSAEMVPRRIGCATVTAESTPRNRSIGSTQMGRWLHHCQGHIELVSGPLNRVRTLGSPP
jgi:hypothetical protein